MLVGGMKLTSCSLPQLPVGRDEVGCLVGSPGYRNWTETSISERSPDLLARLLETSQGGDE